MLDEGDERSRALDACVRLFRERGVEGAVYPAIVRATGLNRKTLYRFWPEKAALVREVLARYRATVLQAHLDRLAAGGLAAFWPELEAEAREGRGCLLLRTAAAGGDPQVLRQAQDWLEALAAALAKAIPAPDPEAAAWQAAGLIALAQVLGPEPAAGQRWRAARLACGLAGD